MTNITSGQIADMEKYYSINLINSLTGYKSLNLLGTINDSGKTNLCIVSSVFHLGSHPPLLGLIIRPEREHNDTLKNIKRSGQYTLNNVLPQWYKQAHQTSASYPSGVSEFMECGFQELYSAGISAPFVAQSTVRIGLELKELVDLKINGTTLVIGEITHILAEDNLIGEDGFLDHSAASTLTLTGLDSYYTTAPLGRLTYAKPDSLPEILSAE
jgi:flavin reductase (DIM6/NTAB) family NADH-FMN oxidoreductase RutF